MSSKVSRKTQQRLEQERKRKQQQYLLIGGGFAAAVLLIAGIVLPMMQPRTPTSTGSANCDNVQTFPDEGRSHMAAGDPTPVYKTSPPTSGTHNPVPMPAGVYDANVDITRLVHSLEHGYIIMYYNGLSPNEINQLISIQNSDPIKTIVAPYPNMPKKVALVAWTRMQTCDGVNEQAIRSFIAQFRNQGPEPFGQ
ncbi:MAG TPA: DUF3105 domain-containing protein [Anaerolineae bacterium]|nr:DUF3105 domain-containing protein [Anaerolineae bacterium]